MSLGNVFIPNIEKLYCNNIIATNINGVQAGQILAFNTKGNLVSANTFLCQTGSDNTESHGQLVLPKACVVKGIFAFTESAPLGGSQIYTLRKNGVATAFFTTITNTNTSANNTGEAIAFAAGDKLSINCVTDVTVSSVGCSILYD